MKTKITALILILTLFLPTIAFAVEIPGYEGGIKNENNYKEIIFITGEPIEMEGTLTIKDNSGSGRGNSRNTKKTEDNIQQKSYTYTYRLKNIKSGASLDRTIKLTEIINKQGKQGTSQMVLDSYTETLKINGKTYKVDKNDYQWNQSQILYETGLVDYYSGEWSARKTYKLNKGAEIITVYTMGELVGYESPWSDTQTQSLNYIIEYQDKLEDHSREGTATVETSYNRTKDFNYQENAPKQIPFHGGFQLSEKQDNVLKYRYDLAKEDGKGRNVGQKSTSIDTNPKNLRLPIPEIRDIRGLDSEWDILLIASMNGFPYTAKNLGPQTAVSRGDFARALANTMEIEIPEIEDSSTKSTRSNRNSRSSRNAKGKEQEQEKLRYIDVPKNHRNYKYIEGVSAQYIMEGVGKGRFEPDRELTKAEATTILIRLLGFQNRAPIGKYSTGFKDDSSIPNWAKDHVYMAKELKIIPSTEYFNPNKAITKEETAVLLVSFIEYLQNDLRYDYRENLLN